MRILRLLCFCALVCMACRSPRVLPRTVTVCPPQTTNCQPSSINPAAILQIKDSKHWEVREVRGLNSDADEWSLNFLSQRRAILTRESSLETHLQRVDLPFVDSAEAGLEIKTGMKAVFGCLSGQSLMVVSSYPNANEASDVDIYSTRIGDNALESLKRLDEISAVSNWDSHPCLSADGTIIFFSSDRPGGFGGTDIWWSRRMSDGHWSAPRNAGSQINSACDELSPFLTSDSRRLYFSSNGHENYGGYDLFSCELAADLGRDTTLRINGNVLNCGPRINTSFDELFATQAESASPTLYFSSNRKGRHNMDIYVATRESDNAKKKDPPPVVIEEKPVLDSVTIRGTVYNDRREKVRRAEVRARDVEKNVDIVKTQTTDSGDYELKVPTNKIIEVVAQFEGGFFDSFRPQRNPRDTTRFVDHDFSVPEILSLRLNFPTDNYLDPYKNVLDTNGAETRQQWTEALDLVADNLKRFSSTLKKVLLVGHTDENGTIEYNNNLGKKRVEFVVEQLVKRGLPKTMFQTRSAGELEPLPRRKDEPLEEYYKRNRRVEFSKISR